MGKQRRAEEASGKAAADRHVGVGRQRKKNQRADVSEKKEKGGRGVRQQPRWCTQATATGTTTRAGRGVAI